MWPRSKTPRRTRAPKRHDPAARTSLRYGFRRLAPPRSGESVRPIGWPKTVARRRRGRKYTPLPRARRGVDRPCQEFRIVNPYDASREHRYVAATRDREATGRLMHRMAWQIHLSAADEKIANIGGGPRIRNQIEVHGAVDHLHGRGRPTDPRRGRERSEESATFSTRSFASPRMTGPPRGLHWGREGCLSDESPRTPLAGGWRLADRRRCNYNNMGQRKAVHRRSHRLERLLGPFVTVNPRPLCASTASVGRASVQRAPPRSSWRTSRVQRRRRRPRI
jgi:hypothetical protein